ncbi:MAG: hypothetical protein EBU90_01590 [Proteobacteria bacterium]|nr:hypothetical protein [Pseudomonadota bacterium]
MNSFERGLHTEFDPAFQPKGSYRDLTNAVRDLSGTLYSERGTEEDLQLPTGFKLVGKILLNQTLVLFISNFAGVSEIGIREEVGYVPYVSNRENSGAKLQLTSDIFSFSGESLVHGTGRENYNNDKIIYFSDGKGVPRVLNLSKIEKENPNTFDESSKLFISRLIPIINYESITDDGECLSGVYQFSARYVSNSGNTSPFGLITNPISIVNDSENSNIGEYDGCLPQTQTLKAINITISNLDSDYPYLEIGMQTYVGLQNTPVYRIVARLNNNKPTQTFKFTGKEDRGSITKDEFIQEGASYSSVSFYQQKNNHLLIAGLKTKNEDYNFEELVANIEVQFTVKETSPNQRRVIGEASSVNKLFPSLGTRDFSNDLLSDRGNILELESQTSGGANSYKSPIFAADNQCYMPDEVYSFAFVPIFKDGTFGFAYPILAPSTLPETEEDWNALYESSSTIEDLYNIYNPYTKKGKLLKYTSIETYTNSEGVVDNIRHFKFPAKRYFSAMAESSEYSELEDEYRSIPARHNCVYGVNFSNINFTDEQKAVLQGYLIVRQKRDTFQNKSVLAQGFAKNVSQNQGSAKTIWDIPHLGTTTLKDYPDTGGDSNRVVESYFPDLNLSSSIISNYCKFYSPDILHNIIIGTEAKKICYGGDLNVSIGYMTIGSSTSSELDLVVASLENTNYGNDSEYDFGFSDIIINRTSAAGSNPETNETEILDSLSKLVTGDPYYDSHSFWRNTGNDYQSFGDQSKTSFYRLNGRLKKTYNYVSSSDETKYNVLVYNRNGGDNVTEIPSPNANPQKQGKLSTHYIKNTNTSQYGKLEDAEYIQAGYCFDLNQTELSIMGGDCFLSYYWVDFKENLIFSGFNRSFFTLVQLPILSEQNYNYRHYIEAGSGQTAQTTEGTPPYYPKETRILNKNTGGRIGIADIEIKNGVSSGYNKQYGFKNITKEFFGKPFLFETVTNFENRVAYSEQLIEGEQLDAFRIFKQNNYQDISKQFGKITDFFLFNEVLYVHCENALYRLAFLQQTTMVTSSGEVALGNGSKLQIAPQIIYDINGGYAGTTTRWANVNTPFGRFFIDTNQKKVFLLSDSIREISDLGMKKLFFNNLKKKTNSYYDRYVGTYDYQNDRYLLFDTDPNFNFGYSYFPKAECWLSRHTWKPEDLFYFASKLFSFSGEKLHIHTDNNNTLIIYGKQEEFSITVVENEQVVQTKRYDNVIMYCEFFRNKNNSGIETVIEQKSILPIHLQERGLSYKNFFDEVTISNDNHLVNKHFSFSIRDINSVLVRRLNSEYRFAIPRNTNPERVKQRITGKFVILSLRKNQSSGDSIKLSWIDITSTPYIR